MIAPKPHERLVRVLTFLRLLSREPGQWNRARLCEHFEVSPRAIDNDLLAPRRAGYGLRRINRAYVLDEDAGNERRG